MGLGGAPHKPGERRPQDSPYPTGSPDELLEINHDISEVFSCAVPQTNQNGIAIIRGCCHATKCAKFFRNKRVGDWGPDSKEPGTPGEGPEHVPFSIETSEGNYIESFMPCHAFMAGLYGRMMAARSADPDSGVSEKIRILGNVRDKEVRIIRYITLPQEPKTCNKSGNNTLITQEEIVKVPLMKRPKQLDPEWKMRRERDIDDLDDFVDSITGNSRAPEKTDDKKDNGKDQKDKDEKSK